MRECHLDYMDGVHRYIMPTYRETGRDGRGDPGGKRSGGG